MYVYIYIHLIYYIHIYVYMIKKGYEVFRNRSKSTLWVGLDLMFLKIKKKKFQNTFQSVGIDLKEKNRYVAVLDCLIVRLQTTL